MDYGDCGDGGDTVDCGVLWIVGTLSCGDMFVSMNSALGQFDFHAFFFCSFGFTSAQLDFQESVNTDQCCCDITSCFSQLMFPIHTESFLLGLL